MPKTASKSTYKWQQYIALTVSAPMAQRYTDRKRDKQTNKQTNKQKTPIISSLAALRRQIATKLGMWIEHVRIIFGPTLTFCVRPVVSELGGFENLGGNDPSQFCGYKFVIYEPNCTKFSRPTLRRQVTRM